MSRKGRLAAGAAAAVALSLVSVPLQAETSEPLKRRITLADGFEARLIMLQGKRMTQRGDFPGQPDLITVFPQPDGGVVLYIGHELGHNESGGMASLSKVAMDAEGNVVSSGTVASGFRYFCSGAVSPWGTVLIGEEHPRSTKPGEGYIWEFDPRTEEITKRESLGRYSHESIAFDPSGVCYLTEDAVPGHLFRFIPKPRGQLKDGVLEALDVGRRRWVRIQDGFDARREVKELDPSAALPAPEGIDPWPGGGFAVAITGDPEGEGEEDFGRVVKLDPNRGTLTPVVRGGPDTLIQPDNLRFRPGG